MPVLFNVLNQTISTFNEVLQLIVNGSLALAVKLIAFANGLTRNKLKTKKK
jgi:hypothetical protein